VIGTSSYVGEGRYEFGELDDKLKSKEGKKQ